MASDLWFWVSIALMCVVIFQMVPGVITIALAGPLLKDYFSARFGSGEGRAVIVPDRSNKARLTTGKFTGTHMDTEKFGSIAWGDGAFSFYGIACGVADPDIGAVMSPWMAAKLQALKDLGFENIKEIIKVHQMLEQGYTIERIDKRIEKQKDQQSKIQNLKQIQSIEVRIKELRRLRDLLEKAAEMGLKKKDFKEIKQEEPKIIDFKSLFNMVHYYINPKLTKMAETSARIDERKRLDQAGIGSEFIKWIGAGSFMLLMFSGIALAYIMIKDSGGGGGSETIPLSLGTNFAVLLYFSFRSKILR